MHVVQTQLSLLEVFLSWLTGWDPDVRKRSGAV